MNLIKLGWNPLLNQYFQQFRKQGLLPARIANEQKLLYLVYSEQGELRAEISGKFRHRTLSRSSFPKVGDWVVVTVRPEEGKATIHALLPRKNSFSRKVAGENTEEQIVAANIDTVFIVSGLDGDFNLPRIERYLTLTWDSGTRPVIVLNKTDICSEVEERIEEVKLVAFGIPIHPICAKKGDGLPQLREYLGKGKTVVLLGSSGVGKSTIINSLLGVERQSVRSVRNTDSHGRHTTSDRELIILPSGGMIIDNPGMRELQMWVDGEDPQENFKDIEELASRCRFRDCMHQGEPDCAIQDALKEGTLERKRFRSYLKLKKELRYLAARKDQKARLVEKDKWKKLSQWSKQMKKDKFMTNPE